MELSKRIEHEKNFHEKKYGEKQNIAPHYAMNPTYHIFQDIKNKMGKYSNPDKT